MYKDTYKYNDDLYTFKLTRKAQIDIERLINDQQKKLTRDEDLIGIMLEGEDALNFEEEMKNAKEIKDAKKRKVAIQEVKDKYVPLLSKLNEVDYNDDAIELYELGYILLKNNPANKPLTEEEYYKMTSEMEDKLGLLETVQFFINMKKAVFLEMEQINKLIEESKKPKASAPEEAIN